MRDVIMKISFPGPSPSFQCEEEIKSLEMKLIGVMESNWNRPCTCSLAVTSHPVIVRAAKYVGATGKLNNWTHHYLGPQY